MTEEPFDHIDHRAFATTWRNGQHKILPQQISSDEPIDHFVLKLALKCAQSYTCHVSSFGEIAAFTERFHLVDIGAMCETPWDRMVSMPVWTQWRATLCTASVSGVPQYCPLTTRR